MTGLSHLRLRRMLGRHSGRYESNSRTCCQSSLKQGTWQQLKSARRCSGGSMQCLGPLWRSVPTDLRLIRDSEFATPTLQSLILPSALLRDSKGWPPSPSSTDGEAEQPGPPKTDALPRHPAAKAQGLQAWEHHSPSDSTGLRRGGPNRLLSHAVQDSTLLKKYLPHARAFMVWARNEGASFSSDEELDQYLADYLADQCYTEERPFSVGSECFHGMRHIFPELHRSLPCAYRAIKTWEKLNLAGEGMPIPEEAVYDIARDMRENHRHREALLVEAAIDAYFRGAEWTQVRAADVADDGRLLSVTLGVSERGERVKTGRNQGVVFDSSALTADLRELLKTLEPQELVFGFSAQHFRAEWIASKRRLGLEWAGPPHDLRHSGAARDVERGSRSLEEVRRRGRWRHIDSVQRYTKTYVLVKQRARMTAEQRDRGAELAKARGR